MPADILGSLFTRIREALGHRAAFFLTKTEKTMGVSLDVSFKTMTHVYLGDLGARASVDLMADQVAVKFYTTMDKKYEQTTGDGKTAKEVVDDFCERVGMDQIVQVSARYLVGWGNLFWWVDNPKKIGKFVPVPLEAIRERGVKFNESGLLDRIELDWQYEPKTIPSEELIHLAYNVITASPLGIGTLYSLCRPLNIGDGEQREPFYKIKGKIHTGMSQTIYKFGAPNEIWSLPGLHKDRVKQIQAQVSKIGLKGARFVWNPPKGSDAKVQTIVAERMRGLDYLVETLDDEYNLGLQTALTRLIAKRGYTEASSKTAEGVSETRVFAIQQFLKRGVERYVFDSAVRAEGLEPEKAQVRLNWGMPEALDYEKLIELLGALGPIVQAYGPSVIRTPEMRKILRDVAKLPLEEEETSQERQMEKRVIVKQ